MALTLENANFAWQRVKIALSGADPVVVAQFKYLKVKLATITGNPTLQFVAFTDGDITGADGVPIADAAAKLYAAYIIKDGTSGTGTGTDAFFKLFDNATVDTTAGDGRVVLPLLVADDERVFIADEGMAMAAGIVATAHTTYSGATDSTAGDAGNGFVLLGAA